MNKKGTLLILGTALISGVSIYLNKFAVSFSDPAIFTFLKNSIVALMLFSIILNWKNWQQIKKLNFKNWIMLLAIGLVGGAIPFILFFKGLALTSAAQGSFIHKTMFLYVAVLAIIFLKEKINKYFFVGAGLVLLGNLLVLKNFSFSFGTGDVLVFVATLFWAAENIISKYTMREIKSDIVATARMFFGAIFILGYLFFKGQAGELFSINLNQIGWVLITAVFLFSYVITWYRGLAKIPVSVATSILLLGSPITTSLSLISANKLDYVQIFSGLLAIVGVVVIILYGYGKNKETQHQISRA